MSKSWVSLKSVEKKLDRWFKSHHRVLPWRENPSYYRVWISEIMLQQTQVVTVIPYFERFMKRFPTLESLAQAPVEDVLYMWSGLGYYSRARNLHKAAKTLTDRQIFPKGFPNTREEWLQIPGIGPYTAGAILSIAGNLPEPILDGNVERVLSRLRRVNRERGEISFKKRLWKLSHILVTSSFENGIEPRVVNQALMELGATVCTPKKPKCGVCPLATLCRANQAGVPEAYPPKKAPKQWIRRKENLHCLINASNQVLLRKREDGEWRAGLWDLLDEKPNADYLGEVQTQHVVTRHKISRTTHVWNLPSSKKISLSADHRWVSCAEPEVAVGSALKKTLKVIRERF